jgi:hypothetical protein
MALMIRNWYNEYGVVIKRLSLCYFPDITILFVDIYLV